MGALRRSWQACCGLALAATATAAALPDLRQPRRAGPLTLFPDDRRPNLFYYPPGDLTLVTDGAGKPDFQLIDMRYTGTRAEGTEGMRHFRSLVSLRIAMTGPTSAELQAARNAFPNGASVELRPLPIARLEATVIYAPLGGNAVAPDSGAQAPRDGHFEANDDRGYSSESGYWTERVFTLRLTAYTSQVFRSALQQGQLVLSLGYAFFAFGIGSGQASIDLAGSPELVDALRQQLAERDSLRSSDTVETSRHLIRAGAIHIAVDTRRWPDLLEQVDLNERVPPGYPLVDVHCYDFKDQLRQDLYAKQVDFRAEGVGGRPVERVLLFSRAQPDLYAHSIRFPFAVNVARPYRYRVTEILTDGRTIAHEWRERDSWAEMLDVTTVARPDTSGAQDPGR